MGAFSLIEVMSEEDDSIMPAGWDLRHGLSIELAWILLLESMQESHSVSFQTFTPKSYFKLVTR